MGIAVPPADFIAASPPHRGDEGARLPAELAFLRASNVGERTLRRAARRRGDDASRSLLVEGGVSDTLYYGSLAHHLGLGLTLDWPLIEGDARSALRRGRVQLAEGGWLLAPVGREIRLLLAARRRGLPLNPAWRITTPAHLAALVALRLPVARLAGEGLAEAAPALSARYALRGGRGIVLALAALGPLASLAAGNRLAIDVLGLIFFAALAFRMMVSAAGWALHGDGLTGEPPPLTDAQLPPYSVLVPLRDEAAMVPSLVAALNALDYPDLGSKLTKRSLGQRLSLAL